MLNLTKNDGNKNYFFNPFGLVIYNWAGIKLKKMKTEQIDIKTKTLHFQCFTDPVIQDAILEIAQICFDNSMNMRVINDEMIEIDYRITGEKYFIGWKPTAQMIAAENCWKILEDAKDRLKSIL